MNSVFRDGKNKEEGKKTLNLNVCFDDSNFGARFSNVVSNGIPIFSEKCICSHRSS